MNETKEDLLDLITTFLNVQEYLDPRVFDKNGKMHNLLRQRILHRAKYMAQESVEKIGGLNVDDVILVGSSVSYFYRQESDLDAVIKVSNKSCPYFSQSIAPDADLGKYLSWLTAYFYSDHQKFYIGKRYLDMKFSTFIDYHFTGLYSLTKDKWLNPPSKDHIKNITTETILEGYNLKCQEIDNFIASLPKDGDKYSQDQCDQMFQFYSSLIIDTNKSIENYIVFKIIKTVGKLKQFGSIIFNEQLKTLEF